MRKAHGAGLSRTWPSASARTLIDEFLKETQGRDQLRRRDELPCFGAEARFMSGLCYRHGDCGRDGRSGMAAGSSLQRRPTCRGTLMLLRILDRLEEILIASLMAAATLIIFVAVVHRYCVGIPFLYPILFPINLSWAQELCIYMFVWMAKFGAAYGVRTGIHVGVDVLVNQLKPPCAQAVVLFGLFCGALFTAVDRHHGREVRHRALRAPTRSRPISRCRAGSSTSAFRSAPT